MEVKMNQFALHVESRREPRVSLVERRLEMERTLSPRKSNLSDRSAADAHGGHEKPLFLESAADGLNKEVAIRRPARHCRTFSTLPTAAFDAKKRIHTVAISTLSSATANSRGPNSASKSVLRLKAFRAYPIAPPKIRSAVSIGLKNARVNHSHTIGTATHIMELVY